LVININFTQPISNVFPPFCQGTNEVNAATLLYRSLYKYKNKKIKRNLVINDTHNHDYTKWTLTLEEYKWSDGSTGNVQDIVKTWEFIIKHQLPFSNELLHIVGAECFKNKQSSNIKGLKVISKNVIEIKFSSPFPHLRELLTNIQLTPLKPNENETLKPYTIDVFNSGKELITSKDTYIKSWNKSNLQFITKEDMSEEAQEKVVNFYFEKDYKIVLKKLDEGFLHIHDGGAPENNESSLQLKKYQKSYDFLSTFYLFLNTKSNKLAISTRRNLRNAVFNSFGELSVGDEKKLTTVIVPSKLRSTKSNNFLKSRLEYSAEILKTELRFICNNEQSYINLSKQLIYIWERELGLKAKLEVLEWDDFIRELSDGNFDISRGGWVADYAHPRSFYEVLTSNSPNNFSFWKDDIYDHYFKQTNLNSNNFKLSDLYNALDKCIYDKAPIIPIYEHKLRQLINMDVRNYEISLTGVINFDSVFNS